MSSPGRLEGKVAIITGAGERIFCAGWDLKALDSGDTPLDNWWEAEDPELGGFAGITEMWNLNKPVIAALNGLTIGGGLMDVSQCLCLCVTFVQLWHVLGIGGSVY